MLTVVAMYWQSTRRTWQAYRARHVNVLQSMFARNLTVPHRFVCATNAPDRFDLDTSIEVVPLWRQAVELGNAYPKLEVFAPYAGTKFGERILLCDLDTLIVGNIDHLVDREEDVVLLPEFNAPIKASKKCLYNTSLVLLNAGTRTSVWHGFDMTRTPDLIKKMGKVGSDQAWVSHVLGENQATWSPEDGIQSFKYEVMGITGVNSQPKASPCPPDARVLSFHGRYKPWDPEIQKLCPWVKENWQ